MRVATILMVAVALLPGCDRHLSEEEFLRQANAVCAEAEGNLDGIRLAKSAAEVDDIAKQINQLLVEMNSDLTSLEPPRHMEPQVEDLVNRFEQQLATLAEVARIAGSGAAVEPESLQAAMKENVEATLAAERSARELGLLECAEVAS